MLRRLLRDDGLRAALPGWILARLGVAVGFVVAYVGADKLQPGARPLQIDQGLFAWDGAFYRDLADYGYHGVAREGLRFFPLLPLSARTVSVPLLGNVGVALLLIVQVAAIVAGVLLYRLAVAETGDRATGVRAAWLLAVLPPATVLVLCYAEGVLLCFAIGFFLCIRSERWWWAALLGIGAGLSRPVGMTLALPALIEAVRLGRTVPWRAWSGRAAAIAGPVVGGGAFLAWAEHVYGDWQLPLRLQNSAELRGGWANPASTIWHAVEAVTSHEWREALHVPWIAVFAVLLVVAFRRLPVSYGAWSAVLLLSALTGQTLGSFERYGLAAFPLVLALAIVTRPPAVERAVLTLCGAALSAFTALLFLGSFVP
jgi:hypothetical protein